MSFTEPVYLPGGKALIVAGKFNKTAAACCCGEPICMNFLCSGESDDVSVLARFTPGNEGGASADDGANFWEMVWVPAGWQLTFSDIGTTTAIVFLYPTLDNEFPPVGVNLVDTFAPFAGAWTYVSGGPVSHDHVGTESPIECPP